MTIALLLVPAALAGDTVTGWGTPAANAMSPQANGLGRGFFGIDLEDLGASGELPVDELSQELMRLADDPNALATTGDPISVPNGVANIPSTALLAYKRAAEILAQQMPNCHLQWSLLASIGRIESGHGNGGQVNSKGDTLDRILGPVLDGNGFAAISDTDDGALDGNTVWDRAVGPMQFIPSTWQGYASDGNNDGVKNPHNFYDAATGAGRYLCAGGVDLSNPQARYAAVFRYNHSDSYVRTVLLWADAYANGVSEIPPGLSGDTGSTGASPESSQTSTTPTQDPIATTPTPSTSTPPPSSSSSTRPPSSSTPTKPTSPSTPPTPPSSTPPSTTSPTTPPTPPTSCEPSEPPSSNPQSTAPDTSSANPSSGQQSDAPSSGTSPQAASEGDQQCQPDAGADQ